MSLTVTLEANQSIRLTDQTIEVAPPARVEFAVEGVLTMTEGVLGKFEGSSIKPVAIELSAVEGETVEIDLSEDASLQVDTVEVGVEIPDSDDLSPGPETIGSATDDSSPASDTDPGAIAFTVEGTITDVPAETRDRLTGTSPKLRSITFTVEDSTRSDGGSGTDVILATSLLGYGISVHRDGTIDVGTGGGATGPGRP